MYWNPEVLTRIDAADDLKIAPYHPDMNTTGTPTWIWEDFTRVFTRETGASPARYVAEARLAAARQRLEQTHETLDRIAEQTGFGSSINLRRLFEKQLNLTPGEYRQRFHCRKMA